MWLGKSKCSWSVPVSEEKRQQRSLERRKKRKGGEKKILGDWNVSVHDLVSIYPAVRSRREGDVDRRGKTEERWGFRARGKWTVSPGRVADHACEHWASHDRRLFDCAHTGTPSPPNPLSSPLLSVRLPPIASLYLRLAHSPHYLLIAETKTKFLEEKKARRTPQQFTNCPPRSWNTKLHFQSRPSNIFLFQNTQDCI